MVRLCRAAQVYWYAVVSVAVVLVAGTLLSSQPHLDGSRLLLALACSTLAVLAKCYPLRIALKTRLTLDTAVFFAVVLLFPPASAMILAGISTLIAQTLTRENWLERLFNTARAVLRVGVATWLLAAAGWSTTALVFPTPAQLALLVAAAGVMYVLDRLLVVTMVAPRTGLPLWPAWRQALTLAGTAGVAQFALGLIAATAIAAQPWTLPLFALPAVAVYHALERHVQLRQQTLEAVEALADLIDVRDRYTSDHSQRVATIARELAIALELPPGEVSTIEWAARVHDVGKIAIDPALLTKEGELNDAEWAELRRHPVAGAEMLSRFPQLAMATTYVLHHHERFDGAGYPSGLQGEAIPLGARIIAVADGLDAMINARPYRPALPPGVVLAELSRQRGDQWDAHIVNCLFDLIQQERITLAKLPVCTSEQVRPAGQVRGARR